MTHDNFTVENLLKKSSFSREVLQNIRMLVLKEQSPIEWRRVTFAHAPGARRFGGIASLLWELEAEGMIIIDSVPTLRGMMKIITIPELKQRMKA